MQPFFEISLQPVNRGSRDAARAIYTQIKAAIVAGQLTPGAKLPATRTATKLFSAARNTVAKAYEMLIRDSLVTARQGSGTYIASPPAKSRLQKLMRGNVIQDDRLNPFWQRADVVDALSFWSNPRDESRARSSVPLIEFRPGIVDSQLFPMDILRKSTSRELRHLEKNPSAFRGPGGNRGTYELRRAITHQVALTRALPCHIDEVLITAGAQQAFDLLARVLVRPSETVVAVEDPGYPPLRIAFAAAGARIVPVPVDEEGMVVEELPHNVNVICVCPSHQFPLGVTMSERRREALRTLARDRRAVVIEDDYDGEFRLNGKSIDSLRSSESSDQVCYVGSFSKCMLPSLRLGFLVAPMWVMPSLVAAKNCSDWHCPILTQRTVAAFIASGHLRRHMERLRRVYQRRRQLVVGLLQSKFADWLQPIPSHYGMHVTAAANTSLDLSGILNPVSSQVRMHTLERYYFGPRRLSGLVFGLGVADEMQIERGLTILHREFLRATREGAIRGSRTRSRS